MEITKSTDVFKLRTNPKCKDCFGMDYARSGVAPWVELHD